jgi:hypothetical protein
MEILKDSPHTWVLKESETPYGQEINPEIAACSISGRLFR